MNQKELNEVRRRYRPDKTNVSKVYGCYVNSGREIISQFEASLGMLTQDESEMYLTLLRKALSGALGRNLLDIAFSNEEVMGGSAHALLLRLRDSSLTDAGAREDFYRQILATLELGGENYLILLACDSYDVPHFGSDGMKSEESTDVYTSLLCAICPVKSADPALGYRAEESTFHICTTGQTVGAPSLGFLFPAFDTRRSNIYNALYYVRKPDEIHPELIEAAFHAEAPLSAPAQREHFEDVLSEALADECSYDVMQSVHEQLRERVLAHKESKDPELPEVSAGDVEHMLREGGVSDAAAEAVREACDERFGAGAALNPGNLVNCSRFEIVTPEAKISVDPAFSCLVETRVIGGKRYILIPADNGMEVNGVAVSVSD